MISIVSPDFLYDPNLDIEISNFDFSFKIGTIDMAWKIKLHIDIGVVRAANLECPSDFRSSSGFTRERG